MPQALSLAADGNSQAHYAKGTPSPHQQGSDRLPAHGFRVFFTPLPEVLFTFPSRYLFAIGLSVVFSLSGWSPKIQPGFLVSRPTQVPSSQLSASRTGPSPSAARRSSRFRSLIAAISDGPITPARALRRRRFGLFPFRSPLLGESLLLSFPAGNKMFQFPAFAPRNAG